MYKIITIAISTLALLTTTASAVEVKTSHTPPTDWIAYAASPDSRIFKSFIRPSEDWARFDAKVECEKKSGRTCTASIAIPPHWTVSAVRCEQDGKAYIAFGASTNGNEFNIAVAKTKMPTHTCVEIYRE
jgi:hypothetical protein